MCPVVCQARLSQSFAFYIFACTESTDVFGGRDFYLKDEVVILNLALINLELPFLKNGDLGQCNLPFS